MGRSHTGARIVNRCICGHHHTQSANAVLGQDRTNAINQNVNTMCRIGKLRNALFAKKEVIKSVLALSNISLHGRTRNGNQEKITELFAAQWEIGCMGRGERDG